MTRNSWWRSAGPATLLTAGALLAASSAMGQETPATKPASGVSEREQRLADRAKSATNERAEPLFRAAETTYLVGDLERASDLYQRVIDAGAGSLFTVRATARMGDCAYELKKFDAAVNLYRRASQSTTGVTDADELAAAVRAEFMIGQSHLAARQYPQAFSQFRRFIDRHSDHALANKAYRAIGDAHLAQGQYTQALQAYRMVGTVMNRQSAAAHRVSPGSRLYMRVNDADVNIGDTLRPVTVIVRTTAGDEERVTLQPTGLRSPVFIGSIATELGKPRHSGRIAQVFTDAMSRSLTEQLTESQRQRGIADEKRREASDLERSASKSGDPAGTERKRVAAVAEADRAERRAAELEGKSFKAIDDAFGAAEKLLAEWAPEESLAAVQARTKPPTTAPAKTDAEAPAMSAAEGEGNLSPAGSLLMPDEQDADDRSAASASGGAITPVATGSLTQAELDQLRIEIKRKPTDAGTFEARRSAIFTWLQQLAQRFQRVELSGNDTMTIEYLDEVGPGGPNDPAKAVRKDSVTVASDAFLAVVTSDGQETLDRAILGGSILVRLEDPDRDATDKPDTVKVVLSAMRVEVKPLVSGTPATQPAPASRVSAEQLTTTPTAMELKIEPLIPPDAVGIEITLNETGPHTGVFERVIPVGDSSIELDGKRLPLSIEHRLRVAYKDERAMRIPDGFVHATVLDVVPSQGGNASAIKFRKSQIDLESKLRRAVAAGELGRIYLDLGLVQGGREYLVNAQRDLLEVAQATPNSMLAEEAMYHGFRIYFYAGMLDEAVTAARQLMAKYPRSEHVPEAMLQIGKVSLERGQKVAEEAKARNEKRDNTDLKRAVGEFEQLVAKYPLSPLAPEALFELAQTKIAMGQSGLDSLERLAKQYPDSGFASRGLIRAADYYVGVGDYNRALDYLNRVLIDYPDSSQLGKVLFDRGVCQLKVGKQADATRTFYQVLEEHPGTDLAAKAQQFINASRQVPAATGTGDKR